MNDFVELYYDCGCVIRLDEKRKIFPTLCKRHHIQVSLFEKSKEWVRLSAESSIRRIKKNVQ